MATGDGTHQTSLAELIAMDDSDLIAWRREAREELSRDPKNDRLQLLLDASLNELTDRAATAWRM
jgi:hypothetical protein